MPLGLEPSASPPPAASGAAPSPVAMPKSPIGGPGGPGGSPMTSPGSGAGNEAHAAATINGFLNPMLSLAAAFPTGSKERNAILRAYQSLAPLFGKAQPGASTVVPAAQQALARQGAKGPLSAAPPPGIRAANTPPPGIEMPGEQPEAA